MIRKAGKSFLRNFFIHRTLIKAAVLFESNFFFKLSERSFVYRLKNKGWGGYMGDTKVFYPENVSIGNRCTFGGNVILNGYGGITIGDNCMFALNSVITTATHDYTLTPMNQETLKQEVKIGNNVWIGTGVIILPGVSICDGTVLAAGTVVTRSIAEENGIYGGIPAKFIKKRI